MHCGQLWPRRTEGEQQRYNLLAQLGGDVLKRGVIEENLNLFRERYRENVAQYAKTLSQVLQAITLRRDSSRGGVHPRYPSASRGFSLGADVPVQEFVASRRALS